MYDSGYQGMTADYHAWPSVTLHDDRWAIGNWRSRIWMTLMSTRVVPAAFRAALRRVELKTTKNIRGNGWLWLNEWQWRRSSSIQRSHVITWQRAASAMKTTKTPVKLIDYKLSLQSTQTIDQLQSRDCAKTKIGTPHGLQRKKRFCGMIFWPSRGFEARSGKEDGAPRGSRIKQQEARRKSKENITRIA